MLMQLFLIIPAVFMVAAASAADLASPLDSASRTSILVLPFESLGARAEQGSMADDYLMEAFAQQKRFTIVERKKLEKVLLEQKLSREKLTMKEQSIMIGRLLSADQMLYGRIEEIRGETAVTMRMVSTSTSESRNYLLSGEVSGARGFRKLIYEMASKVAMDFPRLEGKIVRSDRDSLKADITGPGLRNGLEVIIYRWGDEVRHPTTGQKLGRRVIRVASGTVTAIEGGTSLISQLKTEKKRAVKEGDLIITR